MDRIAMRVCFPLVLAGACSLITPACQSASGNPAAAASPRNGLVFTGRRPDGREIALNDRTKWAIQPAGASATLRWQPGEPVRFGHSGQSQWPAAITSLASGTTAFARPAGKF